MIIGNCIMMCVEWGLEGPPPIYINLGLVRSVLALFNLSLERACLRLCICSSSID